MFRSPFTQSCLGRQPATKFMNTGGVVVILFLLVSQLTACGNGNTSSSSTPTSTTVPSPTPTSPTGGPSPTATRAVSLSPTTAPSPNPGSGSPVDTFDPHSFTITESGGGFDLYVFGNATTDDHGVVLHNTSHVTGHWSSLVEPSAQSWLSTSPSSGPLPPGDTPVKMVVSNASANLGPGDYQGRIDFSPSTPDHHNYVFAYLHVYPIPALSTTTGPASGGTPVIITGAGFTSVSITHVFFGSTEASSITVDSDTQITAISPPGNGTVTIQLTYTTGVLTSKNVNASNTFTYV